MTFSASGQIGAPEDFLVDGSRSMLYPQDLVQVLFGEDFLDDT